jgi:hypothetical protein
MRVETPKEKKGQHLVPRIRNMPAQPALAG